MKSFRNKSAKDMTAAELREAELSETFDRIERRAKQIEAELDSLYFKVAMSHSLLVVRKISEEKLDLLKEIID